VNALRNEIYLCISKVCGESKKKEPSQDRKMLHKEKGNGIEYRRDEWSDTETDDSVSYRFILDVQSRRMGRRKEAERGGKKRGRNLAENEDHRAR
jgi:hypothetical protein